MNVPEEIVFRYYGLAVPGEGVAACQLATSLP